jgi:putative copper export protein
MPHLDGAAVVLWLHIIAASVWIGGQATVAVAVPALRAQPALMRTVGRRYQAIAWPAFAVLIGTGIVNVGDAGIAWDQVFTSSAGRVLLAKLGFVALSGVAAAVHAFVQAPRRSGATAGNRAAASAVLGSLSFLAAVVAALFGVVIAT